jgi:ApeA N-terminal domain 1
MTDHQLNESQEWTGQWWLPDDPDNKVSGILTYDPSEGLRLRLIGGWARPGENGAVLFSDKQERWLAVLGIAEGKYVTLLDTYVLSATTRLASILSGADKLELGATTVLVGCHLADPEDHAFVAGIAYIENLNAWSRRSGIEVQYQFDPEERPSGQSINLSFPGPISVDMGPLSARLHVAWQSGIERASVACLKSFDGVWLWRGFRRRSWSIGRVRTDRSRRR